MFAILAMLIAVCASYVAGNDVVTGKSVILTHDAPLWGQFACSLDTEDCPSSTSRFKLHEQCNTAAFTLNTNFQANGTISFIMVDGSLCETNAYQSPMNYIDPLSVLSTMSARFYYQYYGSSGESLLCYLNKFRSLV